MPPSHATDTLPPPALNSSLISPRGIMLLGYQRTKQISRASRVAWEASDPAVLEAEVEERGAEIFAGAVAEIWQEYLPLRAALTDRPPASVIDIGCGQAINDAFLVRDFGCAVTLVDIEETPRQYHLWSDDGSGYGSLTEAKAFLISNGLAEERLTLINPRKEPDALIGRQADLVTSLFSCGFHYPITEYADLMLSTLRQGGQVMLDLRQHYLRKPDIALQNLLDAADAKVLIETERKFKRMLFRAKTAA